MIELPEVQAWHKNFGEGSFGRALACNDRTSAIRHADNAIAALEAEVDRLKHELRIRVEAGAACRGCIKTTDDEPQGWSFDSDVGWFCAECWEAQP